MGSTGVSWRRACRPRRRSDQYTGLMPVPCLRERLAAYDFTGADRCRGTSSRCGSGLRKALGSHWPWKAASRTSQYNDAARRTADRPGVSVLESPTFRIIRASEIFPTVELIDRLYPPPGLALRFPIPIELTQDELELAARGAFVTRVIYVEDPQQALPVAQRRDSEQPWIEAPPGEDPLVTADRFGRPVAILRIGGRVPSCRQATVRACHRPCRRPFVYDRDVGLAGKLRRSARPRMQRAPGSPRHPPSPRNRVEPIMNSSEQHAIRPSRQLAVSPPGGGACSWRWRRSSCVRAADR